MTTLRIQRALSALALAALAGIYAQAEPRFPVIEAKSLAGNELTFPKDLGSPAAVVFVAFQMKQQADIDAWKAFAEKARASWPTLRVWEMPTIGAGYKFMRGIIEGGMRSGIKNQGTRESTVTLFLDAAGFATSIGAAGMNDIAVLVVAPDGRILGSATGKPLASSEAAIEKALSAAFGKGQ